MEVMNCPHCGEYVFIEEINCGIFRHGFDKNTLEQLPPHAPKNICDQIDKIYGCGKPFRVLMKDNKHFIEICDYI